MPGCRPAEVDAVEAHGTGTTLGDPIEAQALLATYGQGRQDAVVAGVGEVEHRSHPGRGGCRRYHQDGSGDAARRAAGDAARGQASSHVDWASGAVRLLTEARPWRTADRPRRAGVSSFGISGTNAHIILEEAPAA